MSKVDRKEVVAKYVDDVTSVAVAFGISPQQVRNILKAEGVELVPGKRGRKRVVGAGPVSEFHAFVGQRIVLHRIELNVSTKQFATKSGLTHSKLEAIERGVTDATLSELIAIAKGMGRTVSELVKEP